MLRSRFHFMLRFGKQTGLMFHHYTTGRFCGIRFVGIVLLLQVCGLVAGQSNFLPTPVLVDDDLFAESPHPPLHELHDGDSFEHSWAAQTAAPQMIRSHQSNGPAVDVPEPLLFDLVRPLGARKGEVEFNTLAIFPWSARNRNLEGDPFGPGPTTPDRGGIEWAPEVEVALADNFAIEFEFPFENSTLEEYKLGLQWTFGTAFNNSYIHGVQALIEPSVEWEQWNTTLLYLGGVRFDETWSALFMLGGRMDLEGPANSETFERLINASLFADITDSLLFGVETNYASSLDESAQLIVIPQLHAQLTNVIEIQTGLGFGAFTGGYEQSFILRVIWSP